jgi:hypothetical protein
MSNCAVMKALVVFILVIYINSIESIEPILLVHGGAGTIAANRVSLVLI